jgi:hypothetical protein
MLAGRQADSARRRQRVIATLSRAAASGEEISVSGIARAAEVDRTLMSVILADDDPHPP